VGRRAAFAKVRLARRIKPRYQRAPVLEEDPDNDPATLKFIAPPPAKGGLFALERPALPAGIVIMPSLKNRAALITGAGQGIGAAIARAFHREGAHVLITDIDLKRAQMLATELGERAEALRLDVGEEEDWRAAEAYVDALHGGLDILVNNAGVTGFLETEGPHDPEHFHLASWRAVHRVNLDGLALGCRTAIALMKHRRAGSIINLSSRSGVVGIPGAAAYASSKAAVRNHTRTVALYCAQQGYSIRCNALLPAAILTPMWDAMLGDATQREAILKEIAAGVPMGRFGTPEEVAEAAVFLAGDASSYMTGTGLDLDGGILAGAEAAPGQRE
jgi:3(or 17)beta-hydroxysteroid dehydrogenase